MDILCCLTKWTVECPSAHENDDVSEKDGYPELPGGELMEYIQIGPRIPSETHKRAPRPQHPTALSKTAGAVVWALVQSRRDQCSQMTPHTGSMTGYHGDHSFSEFDGLLSKQS